MHALNPERGKIPTPNMDRLADGRSTPGAVQHNDVKVEIFKSPQARAAVNTAIGD